MSFLLRKHVHNTDVAIEVLKTFLVHETKTLKLKVAWWNIGKCHAPWPMGIEQKIEVPLAAWKDWKPYTWRAAA